MRNPQRLIEEHIVHHSDMTVNITDSNDDTVREPRSICGNKMKTRKQTLLNLLLVIQVIVFLVAVGIVMYIIPERLYDKDVSYNVPIVIFVGLGIFWIGFMVQIRRSGRETNKGSNTTFARDANRMEMQSERVNEQAEGMTEQTKLMIGQTQRMTEQAQRMTEQAQRMTEPSINIGLNPEEEELPDKESDVLVEDNSPTNLTVTGGVQRNTSS